MKNAQNARKQRGRPSPRKAGRSGGGRDGAGNRNDNRSRGNPKQLLEKYKTQARDALQSGDPVNAEYYFQFADPYQRIVNDKQWNHTDPLMAFSDAMMLERIVRNLLSNAIRYTDDGGVIVACRLRGEDQLSLEVWDTGKGIADDQQQRIFQSHQQLENQQQDANKGFGLGLSVVKRLAGELTHPLTLRSKEGHGSVFILTVPRAKESSTAPEYHQENPIEG
ncbi:MAG: hypothetical protein COB37_09345, partial [Kordiimonadales bacterium]